MPVPALKSVAAKYGVPLEKAESFWNQAKAEYDGDYAAVMGTDKKMCSNYSAGRCKALKKK